jgi:hypothetical protein
VSYNATYEEQKKKNDSEGGYFFWVGHVSLYRLSI